MKRALDEEGPSSVAKKPLFLTKSQREQLALQRREEEASEQRKRLEEQRKRFSSSAERPSDQGDRHRQRDKDREHERDRDRELEKERRDRDREREEEAKIRERGRLEKQSEREKEKELEAIKEQYLGTKKPKKRVIKPSEKFRFSFDWENTEDTSRDMNFLYQNPHEAQLLFGRGFRAGMDRREQKKLAAKNEKDLRAQIRTKEGVEEKPEEAAAQRQKEEAANVYDTFDMRVDRHWSEKKLEEMTERDWRIFREDFNISYKGSRIPRPMRNWEEGNLTSELLKAVYKAGYKKPSPIQMAAIPLGLQQRDVIGIAETGSGKTAAFVLPMLTYISRLPPMTEEIEAEGPYAVVMAPTRELAQQIEEETIKFAHYLDIRVVSIVGGQSIEEQGFKLRQGCEIVIATPGRLLDCLERRYAVLNQCNYVVLDEADRMIDMGFEPQVVGVLDAMPSSNLKPENEDEELDEKRIYRTTYMFSATMPPAVERLARKYLRNPVVVTIGTAGKATELITQHVIMLKETEKMGRLQRLLNDLGDKTAIVFINTKKTADSLSRQLDKMGYRVTTLHGGKTQEQREISLEGFRNKRFNVLVATDVAGRAQTGRRSLYLYTPTFINIPVIDSVVLNIEMEMNKGSIDSSSIVPPRLEDAGLEDCALSPKGIKEAFMRAAQAVKSTASTILNKNDGDCIEVGGPSDGECTDDLQDYSTEGGRGNQSCVESLAGGLVEEGRDKVVDIEFDGDIGDEVVDVGPSQKTHLWEEDDDDGGCVPGLGLLPDPAKVEGDDDEEKEEVPILIEGYV